MRASPTWSRAVVLAAFALAVSAALHCNDGAPTAPPVTEKNPAFDVIWPFFSHDGSKIFFVGKIFGAPGMGVYEVDIAGGKATQLMWDTLYKAEPKLSPDGQQICYRAAPKFKLECCSQLFMMNADGTNKHTFTPWSGYLENIHWSPDGKSIIAQGPVEEGGEVHMQIFKMRSDGTGWTLLTRGGRGHSFGRWDCDGSSIFYETPHPTNELSSVVSIMNADGSNGRPIDSTLRDGHYVRPSPSRREAALLWKSDALSELGGYIVGHDSLFYPTGEGSFRKISGEFPYDSEWSPDGDHLAQVREGPAGSLTADLFLLRRDGWTLRRLTEYYRISFWNWSRDSKYIVFSSTAAAESRSGTFIVDVASGSIRKLTIHQ